MACMDQELHATSYMLVVLHIRTLRCVAALVVSAVNVALHLMYVGATRWVCAASSHTPSSNTPSTLEGTAIMWVFVYIHLCTQ